MRPDIVLALAATVGLCIAGASLIVYRPSIRHLWAERCRYGLARHKPIRVITSARLMSVDPLGGSEWAIMQQYHRCRACNHPLNEPHPVIRPLEPTA